MHERSSAGRALAVADGQLSPNELHEIASHLAGQEDLWRPQVRHDPEKRWRTQLLWSPQVEIWLVGWDAGQGVDLHDHGGASGAFSVCEGAVEVRHGGADARQRLRTVHRSETVTFGSEDVHEVVNRSASPATTIHAYSPALTAMAFYETVDGALVATRREAVGAPEPTVVATPSACF